MLVALLGFAALITATLSGVFGMAGGMVLMGVYAALLPVPSAMVLHGTTQWIANGSRAVWLWRDVYWRGVAFYAVGALSAFVVMSRLQYVPEPLMVFLGLGLAPFVARVLPAKHLDFERSGSALACGAIVATGMLIAGATGPLLDVMFVETRLTRTQVVSTKAISGMLAHSFKLAYFAPLVHADVVTPTLAITLLLATLLGTRIGTLLLARMSDHNFRNWSRRILYAIGTLYLVRAALLW